jgi:hypothetical protein
MWATIWVILKPHVGGMTMRGMTRNLQVVLITGGAVVASRIFEFTPLPIILVGTLIGFLWKDAKDS